MPTDTKNGVVLPVVGNHQSMSPTNNSATIEFVPRCLDITGTDAAYQASKLLATDWSLTWTERIIDDSPNYNYNERLAELLQLWDERFQLALAVPDPEVGCLQSLGLDTPKEVQMVRTFLLAVVRHVAQHLGADAPYELYWHYQKQQQLSPHWVDTNNTTNDPSSFTEGLPADVQRCVRDEQWTRLFFVQAPAATIGQAYNTWRMRKHHQDPIAYDTVVAQAEEWKTVILLQEPPPVIVSRNNADEDSMRVSPMQRTPKKRSRSGSSEGEENHTASSSSSTATEEELAAACSDSKRPRRQDTPHPIETALRLVVPPQCIAYANATHLELSSILEKDDTGDDSSLLQDMLRWRRTTLGYAPGDDDDATYVRTFVSRDMAQWRLRVQAVLRGVEVLVLAASSEDSSSSADAEAQLLAQFVQTTTSSSKFHTYLTEQWQCTSCAAFGALDPVMVEQGYAEWQHEKQRQQETVEDTPNNEEEREASVVDDDKEPTATKGELASGDGPQSFLEWQREKQQQKEAHKKESTPATNAAATVEVVHVAHLQEQVFALFSAVQVARGRSSSSGQNE